MTHTWFITAVNSGFGREMSQQLLARGHRVVGTVRELQSVDDLRERYPESFRRLPLDVTDIAAIPNVVRQAFAEYGRIDVVMNNAGYGLFGPAEGLTSEQIRDQIDTNLVGPIHVTRAALPHLRAQGGGRIVAMSTYGGQAAHPGASLYHASKWGLEGFFESLAAEVAFFDIGVTIVEPGSVRTAFRCTAGARMGADLPAYKDSPIGALRARLADPAFAPNGDLEKMVRVIIASAHETPAPRRIVLGTDAYNMIHKALSERLAGLEAQKQQALSTDSA